MAWARIDDGFDEHPKIVGLSDHGLALFVCGLAYCSRNLTDGFIPTLIGYRLRPMAKKGAAELVAQGLWVPMTGGWRVHDYLDFNPSKERVMAERARTADRVSRHRNGVTAPITPGPRNAVTHSAGNGGGNAVSNLAPYPSRTHPVLSTPPAAPPVRARGREDGFRPGELPPEMATRLARPPIDSHLERRP